MEGLQDMLAIVRDIIRKITGNKQLFNTIAPLETIETNFVRTSPKTFSHIVALFLSLLETMA